MEKFEIVDFNGKSKVWKYFGFKKVFKEGGPPEVLKDKAICKICKVAYKYTGGTTNLIVHLEHSHNINLKTDGEKNIDRQPKIAAMFGGGMTDRGPLPEEKKKLIEKKIQEFLIKDVKPLSTVEGEGFKDLIKACEPRYKIPCRRTVISQMAELYEDLKCKVKSTIKKIDFCGVTHDLWTSLATQSFGAVTIHFVDDEWKLQSLLLEASHVEESHTAENIARSLTACQREWGFPEPIGITDNAANEQKAFRILKWTNISCMGHNINLAVRAALAVGEAAKIIAKGRKVVSYFHASPTATSVLHSKQLLLNKPEKRRKLIQDVSTRWNSTLDMLERLLEQTPALHATLCDEVLKKPDALKYLYDAKDQGNVEAMIALLKPFKDATINMSREMSPSMPAVYPSILKLKTVLKPQENDSPLIVKMKHAGSTNFEKRYHGQDELLLMASFLHPRTKALLFISEDLRSKVTEKTEQMLVELVAATPGVRQIKQEEQSSDEAGHDLPVLPMPNLPSAAQPSEPTQHVKKDPDEEPPMKRLKSEHESDVMDWLDDVVIVGETQATITSPQTIARSEMERYMSEPTSKNDPLEWWRERERVFPNLSRLAKKFLCLPASSVPSERVFSLAGHLVSKKRANLCPENVNMLLFLHKNYGKI